MYDDLLLPFYLMMLTVLHSSATVFILVAFIQYFFDLPSNALYCKYVLKADKSTNCLIKLGVSSSHQSPPLQQKLNVGTDHCWHSTVLVCVQNARHLCSIKLSSRSDAFWPPLLQRSTHMHTLAQSAKHEMQELLPS